MNLVSVAISITTLDQSLTKIMEPRTSAPHVRLDAIGKLADVGCPTMVMVAPIIPGINAVSYTRLTLPTIYTV